MLRPARMLISKKQQRPVRSSYLRSKLANPEKPQASEQALCAFDHLLVALSDDAQRVPQRGGIVVLQAHDAARDRADVAFAVGEGVEDAQVLVAAGDEVLHHQLAVVVGRAHVAPDTGQLLGDSISYALRLWATSAFWNSVVSEGLANSG